MKRRTDITFTIRPFGTEDSEESITAWQAAGVVEIWRATRELTVLSYALRGIDVRTLPMRRDLVELRTVPWLSGAEEDQDG